MANEGYHEPAEELSEETRDMHRAITSLMENIENSFSLTSLNPLTIIFHKKYQIIFSLFISQFQLTKPEKLCNNTLL